GKRPRFPGGETAPRPLGRRRGGYNGRGNLHSLSGAERMRIDFYGLSLDTSAVTFYLWSPWRCTALEHKLFEVVRGLPQTQAEDEPDQRRVNVRDPKAFKAAVQALERVMKGWQEEAEMGGERRRSEEHTSELQSR